MLVTVGASACVVEVTAPRSGGVAVSGPPPQPLEDGRPRVAPEPGIVWVAGYWHWNGMQYTWIPGHFERPPTGAQWRSPTYSTREGAYFYEPGRWSSPTK